MALAFRQKSRQPDKLFRLYAEGGDGAAQSAHKLLRRTQSEGNDARLSSQYSAPPHSNPEKGIFLHLGVSA